MQDSLLTIEELVDQVQSYLTMSRTLPCYLKDEEILRIIQQDAEPWIYKWHRASTQKVYYYVPNGTLTARETGDKYQILLPDVEAVSWIFLMNDRSLFQIGMNAPNMQINVGVTNQPYINSFLTTVGDLGVYKVAVDSFADVMNSLTKTTVKYEFNANTKLLWVGTKVTQSLMLEVYARIPREALYADPYFQRYAKALAKVQLGNLLSFADMPLAGNVKLNGDAIRTQGETDRDKVIEEIKDMNGSSSFFRMVRR